MRFALVLLLALAISALASQHGHKARKVVQLSAVPMTKGPMTYNTIPVSIWSDGTVVYTIAPAAPESAEELATVSIRQVLTGKIDVDDLADFLLFAVDNEYNKLENKYEDATIEPNEESTCMTIFDKSGAFESCEMNNNVAPQLFQDLICKIRALVGSAHDTKPFVPKDAYIRAYSISKKGITTASIWNGKQLLVDADHGVWFHKHDAETSFDAAIKGTVFDYQGQYVQLTAQVRGVSLVEPMNKEGEVQNQYVIGLNKIHFAMLILCAFVVAFIFSTVVYFVVKACCKAAKTFESDADVEDGRVVHHACDSDCEEESIDEEERPLLTIEHEQTVEVANAQHVLPINAEPTQYFYMIPQNQVVFPGNEQYVLPANFGPFPQALAFNAMSEQQ